MSDTAFLDMVSQICARDPRYAADAYFFIREGLDFTTKKLKRPRKGPRRHVTGAELAEGIRQYALKQFGPMTRTVLKTWGLEKTADFGEIVFNLVESGVLGKTAEDNKSDFENRYDFDEAFVRPFLARGETPLPPRGRRGAKHTDGGNAAPRADTTET